MYCLGVCIIVRTVKMDKATCNIKNAKVIKIFVEHI